MAVVGRVAMALAFAAVVDKLGHGATDMRTMLLVFAVAWLALGLVTAEPSADTGVIGADSKRTSLLRMATPDPRAAADAEEIAREQAEQAAIEREIAELRAHVGDVKPSPEEEGEEAEQDPDSARSARSK